MQVGLVDAVAVLLSRTERRQGRDNNRRRAARCCAADWGIWSENHVLYSVVSTEFRFCIQRLLLALKCMHGISFVVVVLVPGTRTRIKA